MDSGFPGTTPERQDVVMSAAEQPSAGTKGCLGPSRDVPILEKHKGDTSSLYDA